MIICISFMIINGKYGKLKELVGEGYPLRSWILWKN
nr:MAG TPA: hypothetical protein [Bacteriophage sp.]